ncbi:hypothetical protein LTR97_009503 [Elasticomyces elasticus]|uniref:Exonuclease domain-containing protein n=1 Tax=Elasticomyces elasticus TaxID=574655 RepID=A0AAN7W3Q2_9PEZI|nr:hypothetical protein LTR97_009503 [Elasticomyces elasticus]
MDNKLPTFRSVRIAPNEFGYTDEQGKLRINFDAFDVSGSTRAHQIVPRWDLITPIIAFDIEFQLVFIEATGKHRSRIGRISIVNYWGQVIYDVFAYFDEEPGMQKRLPPKRLRLGVYKADVQLKNGARHIDEVEANVKEIVQGAEILVGHAIANDIRACSPGLVDGIQIRDTQFHEPYRVYGKLPKREPKLSVLSVEVLGIPIQMSEHASDEDGATTVALYRHDEAAIEAAQGGSGKYYSGKEIQGGDEEIFEFDESELEDASDEVFHDLVKAVEEAQKMPLSASGCFWQQGPQSLKAVVTSNTTQPKQGPRSDSMSSGSSGLSNESNCSSATVLSTAASTEPEISSPDIAAGSSASNKEVKTTQQNPFLLANYPAKDQQNSNNTDAETNVVAKTEPSNTIIPGKVQSTSVPALDVPTHQKQASTFWSKLNERSTGGQTAAPATVHDEAKKMTTKKKLVPLRR